MLDTDALTKKVGPLPAYGWAVIGVGGYLAYQHFHNAGSSAPVPVDPGIGASDGTDLTGNGASTDNGSSLTTASTVPVGTVNQSAATTNTQWGINAVDYLDSIGTNPITAANAVTKYLSNMTLLASDAALINKAIAAIGSPPEGAPGLTTVAGPPSKHDPGAAGTAQKERPTVPTISTHRVSASSGAATWNKGNATSWLVTLTYLGKAHNYTLRSPVSNFSGLKKGEVVHISVKAVNALGTSPVASATYTQT
jgi:hypothetical protein